MTQEKNFKAIERRRRGIFPMYFLLDFPDFAGEFIFYETQANDAPCVRKNCQ